MQRGVCALLTSAWLGVRQRSASCLSSWRLQDAASSPHAGTAWLQQLLQGAPFATRAPGYQGLLPREKKLVRPVTHAALIQKFNSCQDVLDIQFLMGRHPTAMDHHHTSSILVTTVRLLKLGFVDTPFLLHIMDHARPQLKDLAPADLANMLWVMAMLDHHDAGYVDQLLGNLLADTVVLTPPAVCNTMSALSILAHDPVPVIGPLLKVASTLILSPISQEATIPKEGLRKVYQYLVTMEAAGHISSSDLADPTYQRMRAKCKKAWGDADSIKPPARPTFTQREVIQVVRLLPGCKAAAYEQPTEDKLLTIDIALQLPNGTKVAVEVNDPTLFMANFKAVPPGLRVWRDRMLEARGWRVVHVSSKEWKRLGKDKAQQQELLAYKFKEAGIEL